MRWRKSLHTNKRSNTSRGNNNYQLINASNVSAPNFIKHTLKDLKPHIDPNTVVVEDFNNPLSPIERSSKQKNQQRNSRIKWHHRSNGTDRCLQSIPSCSSTIYVLRAQGTFSKIDHILGHKASLNKCKKTEITPCILSNHKAIKLELNNKSSTRK
jgi:hypothetical protein